VNFFPLRKRRLFVIAQLFMKFILIFKNLWPFYIMIREKEFINFREAREILVFMVFRKFPSQWRFGGWICGDGLHDFFDGFW
jgi:hypothetical protein